MIKAIIFDIGGVVIFDNPLPFLERFEKESGLGRKELYSYTIETREWTELYNKGRISENDLWKAIEEGGRIKKAVLEKMRSAWRDVILKPIKGTLDIIKQLKNNYKVYALSNVDKDTVNFVKKKFSVYKIFDGGVFSCDIGLIKPEPEIYKFVLKKFGLVPEECIFIDNRQENVDAAEKAGIKSILFESPEQLKRDLVKMGVNV